MYTETLLKGDEKVQEHLHRFSKVQKAHTSAAKRVQKTRTEVMNKFYAAHSNTLADQLASRFGAISVNAATQPPQSSSTGSSETPMKD